MPVGESQIYFRGLKMMSFETACEFMEDKRYWDRYDRKANKRGRNGKDNGWKFREEERRRKEAEKEQYMLGEKTILGF
jgi:hypothetical protein